MAARSAWMIWSSLALVDGRGLLDLTRLPITFQRFSMKLTTRVDFESSENVTLLQYWRAQARRRVMLMAYRTRQKAGLRDLKPPSRSRRLEMLLLLLAPVSNLNGPLKVTAVEVLSLGAPMQRWRSCCHVVARGLPTGLLSLADQVAINRCRSRLMTKWDT